MVGIRRYTWTCAMCGFVNHSESWECQMCPSLDTLELKPPAIKSQKIHNEERADDLITALWRNGIGSKVEWAMELADLLEVLE